MKRIRHRSLFPFLLFSLLFLISVLPADAKRPLQAKPGEDRMSAMGRLAARARAAIQAGHGRGHLLPRLGGTCGNEPDCGDDSGIGDAGGTGATTSEVQAELSIAVDSTGQHVVVGFNDFRGVDWNPISISGFFYSDDGGVTFVDGGQLPSPGGDTFGDFLLPAVFGDPDVKYLGGCNFIYSSIVVAKFPPDNIVQTLGVHRSTDCGHTWVGPFVVDPATNPHGAVDGGSPVDAADKELLDVDPDTGRVLLSWTNFTSPDFAPGGAEMSSTYSDNLLTGTPPTWSARRVVSARPEDGQGSVPRFAGNGSPNAYMAWQRFPSPGTFLGKGNTIAFACSTDNGATWGTPIELAPEFFTIDQVLGNDRVHTLPSLAVDNSHGPRRGSIYVVYANNDNRDGADIVFQRSADGGSSFSAPLRLNSRPGHDRAQWFPWVTVDRDTGRVWVFYYDQGIATSGDLTESTVVFSDDGGVHWSAPQPLTDRPFHAAWGNDTLQPNLGDYNQAVAQKGELFAAFAGTSRPPLGFVDGQPSASMTVPDALFRRVPQGKDGDHHTPLHPASRATNSLTVALAAVTYTESGGNGNIDPGDLVTLKLTLRNYDTNPLSVRRVDELQATLATPTPGVTVVRGRSSYPAMNPGGSAVNPESFRLEIAPSFVPGTPIELVLTVRGEEQGTAVLRQTLLTGTPVATTLFAESFDATAPGTLPAGWTTVHSGGNTIVPWTTSASFCGTGSNGAFHQEAEDGLAGNSVRFERLFSPAFSVPAGAQYVTVDFDVCYDTEDDPAFNVKAEDGFLVRLTDVTPGHTLRSVLADAFADELTTGSLQGFPKHLPRSDDFNYFSDMSVWAGDSHGVQHVHMRLPGMAGSTAFLRFEYTQDAAGTCTLVRPGHSCGVLVDNIVVKSVVSAP
jgi:hypothetical protein